MPRRNWTVASLATAAGLEPDDVLVLLWDAGIEYPEAASSPIHKQDKQNAVAAVGLTRESSLDDVGYWTDRLGMTREELTELIGGWGLSLGAGKKKLPKGSISRLLKFSSSRLASPHQQVIEAKNAAALPSDLTTPPKKVPTLVWREVGAVRDVKFLGADEIRAIHDVLERHFAHGQDPITPPGVRDTTLLESAAHRPRTSLGNIPKYPTVEMASAALLHSLVHNHPFYNGNKRTALVAMLVMLEENNYMVTCNDKALFRLVLRVAKHGLLEAGYAYDAHDDRECLAVAEWLRANSREIMHGDRPLKFHELKTILAGYGCTFESPRKGNRINISRSVERRRRSLFGRTKTSTKLLQWQTWYGGDGREIERNSINEIRKHLELDIHHGIDSKDFYEGVVREASDFIDEYRGILGRLARL